MPEDYKFLFVRKMIKVVQLDEKEFRVIGGIVAGLQHEGKETSLTSLGNAILLALLVTLDALASSGIGLFIRYNKPLTFQSTDKGVEHPPTNMAKRPQWPAENVSEEIAVMWAVHQL